MILSAKIPRWWNVTPPQVHWVGLHLRYGRELLAEAALDPALRAQVVEALSAHAAPVRTALVNRLIERGEVKDAAEQVTPSELFSIARDLAPKRSGDSSCVRAELVQLAGECPQRHQLRGHFARLRHAQAHAREFLRAGAAQPPHLPHADGLFQPDHGRELGIEHAVLGGPGGRNQRHPGAAQRADSRMDPETGGADFRFAPGGLARSAEIAPRGGRRCARAQPGRQPTRRLPCRRFQTGKQP